MSKTLKIGYSIHKTKKGKHNIDPVSKMIDIKDINHIEMVQDHTDDCVWVTVNKSFLLSGKYSYQSEQNTTSLEKIIKIIKEHNISYDVRATNGEVSWNIPLSEII